MRYREKVELCEEDARQAKTVARAAKEVFEKYLAKMLDKDGHAGRGNLVRVHSFLASKCELVPFFTMVFNLWLLISL